MNIFLWIVLFIVTFAAFFPMTIIKIFNSNKRYRYFKFVSILLFVWTIQTWLRLLITEPYVQYYLGLNLYPMIFLVVGTLHIAIRTYIGHPILKIYKWMIGIFFIIELIVVNTNSLHLLVWELAPSNTITYLDTANATVGLFFYIHTAICYLILVYICVELLSNLYKRIKQDQDYFPFLFVFVGILIGITLNIIHIFFVQFIIDPTFIAFVIIILMYYFVVYIRDIKLILMMNRNEFILDNLREMYIIVNQRNEVIDASQSFIDYFNLNINDNILFEDLLFEIQDRAVIFTEPEDLQMEFDSNRRYLHMLMKLIDIPLYKYPGKFYLFYDESEHQKYINDMNYVKSHDLMTGLYNRNHFEEIKSDIDESSQSYVLVLFDLDGLKQYNDYLGHGSGDNLLVEFAKRLKEVSKRYNLIPIRMGGDEFLLIAMNLNIKMIESSMVDIVKMLKSTDGDIAILFSYGYAERESHSELLERVVSRADKNMYSMKEQNRPLKKDMEQKLKERAKKNLQK